MSLREDVVYECGMESGRCEGHELAREIIAKHGVDRYPDANLNLLKLFSEAGELADAALDFAADGSAGNWEHLRKEYADAGLTLYALGNKLGLDLFTEMQRVVDNETRRFS
jgi:NTP pyrophosphatase (non-canonical NTP hydrolase)